MQQVLDNIAASLIAENDKIDAKRLFHGRGGVYPGLNAINVDWIDPVLLITLYQLPDQEEWDSFVSGLSQFKSTIPCVLVQRRYVKGSALENLWGAVPENTIAEESGLKYRVTFSGNQNIGFFLDMAPGRQWIKKLSKGKRVLNLFSYTCAFSVVAIEGGANTVFNVDMSKAALNTGRYNHQLNDQQEKLQRDIQFLPYNLFRSWKRVVGKGPYDLVVIDPPSRQKGSFVAESDYVKVIRRLETLMPDGGDILACLNAPTLNEDFLHNLFTEACPQAHFVERIKNSVDFPETDSNRNLKMLHYRMPRSEASLA